jgi:hypothetical protein
MTTPELPRLEVIAACYAALKPPEEVWQRYSEEIEKLRASSLITSEDHLLMRSDIAIRIVAQNHLLQPDDDWIGRSPQLVLERVKANLIAEKEAEATEQLAAKDKVIFSADSKLSVAEAKVSKLEQQEKVRQAKYERWGQWIGKSAFYIVLSCLGALVLGAAITPFISDSATKSSHLWKWGTSALLSFSFAWGVLSGIFGVSCQGLAQFVERKVSVWITKQLLSIFEVKTTES